MIKVVFEFFTELVSALRVRDITLTAVLLIQLVSHGERNILFGLEEKVVLLDEVVEYIRLHHHFLRLIVVVVVLTKTTINPKAVISYLTKLVSNLSHQSLILVSPHSLSGGGDINQSSDDS